MAEQKSAKVIIIFKSTPGAPALEKPKYGFFANHTVQKVLTTLRKLLNLTNETPLYVFLNNSFTPSSDRTLEQLCQLYGKFDAEKNTYKITMTYSTVEAWG